MTTTRLMIQTNYDYNKVADLNKYDHNKATDSNK